MYHDTSLSSGPRLPAVPATAGENGSFGSYPDTRYELEKMLFSFSVLAITINNNQETPTWSQLVTGATALHGQCQRLQDGGQRWPGQDG